MKKLTHAEILKQRKSVEEMQKSDKFPFVVLLNNIRSMHNVGSIFRTSDAAFIEKIYITGYTATPPREEIEKTALGATETVDWEYFKNPLDAIKKLKKENYSILALEQSKSSLNFYDFELPKQKICLILGNEVFGTDQELLNLADAHIEIPMFGMKHSLNVSVAYGISIFELIKKYMVK
jgi:tRNA G18 (ribose-2'-O)-methylase SpoU